MTLTFESASNFYYFRVQFPQSILDRFLPNFQNWWPYGHRWLLWNWVAIVQGTLPWQPIFVCSIHTFFFRHSDQCVINFVHPATTRSTIVGVIHEVDRRRLLLTTTIHRETDIAPWTFPARTFPRHSRATGRDTTRSASAALNVGEPVNWPINNNWQVARGIAGWATSLWLILCIKIFGTRKLESLDQHWLLGDIYIYLVIYLLVLCLLSFLLVCFAISGFDRTPKER